MKTVLVILTHANLAQLQVNESISAALVMATFGSKVQVLLKESALSLLNENVSFDQAKQAFKPASNLVEGFEFYDLTPVLVESKLRHHPFVQNSQQELEFIELDAAFIQLFDHVLYW